MKKIIFLFISLLAFLNLYSQIEFENDLIKDLEIYNSDDTHPFNRVNLISEINHGFVYINKKSITGGDDITYLIKTNEDLSKIDSLVLEELDLASQNPLFFGMSVDTVENLINIWGKDFNGSNYGSPSNPVKY